MVQAEEQERVGIVQHPTVEREAVSGLVHPLEYRDRMAGCFRGKGLERLPGAEEKLERAGYALREQQRIAERRTFIGGPGHAPHLGHG
jgi:hypothetical protein